MKSVLVISQDSLESKTPGANRIGSLCEALSGNFIKPIFITRGSSSDVVHCKKIVTIKLASFDARRVLSINGKSSNYLLLPDRHWPWCLRLIMKASTIIKEHKPRAIIVSVPSYSAALAALTIAKLFKIKLIVDLRDPFRFRYDPYNVKGHFFFKFIEKHLLRTATKIFTATKETQWLIINLYPELHTKDIIHVGNGYNEEIININPDKHLCARNKFRLLHVGTLYSIGRDPLPILEVLSNLKKMGIIAANNFSLDFRGAVGWKELFNNIKRLDIEDLVNFLPTIDYYSSIKEMKQASGLLVIQEEIFNCQIPSKLYDYIACQKPILVYTSTESATEREAQRLKIPYIANDAASLLKEIATMLKERKVSNLDIITESRKVKSNLFISTITDVIGAYDE